jgi:adenylate kinase
MILVTGISGVGKTYTIAALTARAPTFRYIRASRLLMEMGFPTTNLSAAQTVVNQQAIASKLKEMATDDFAIIIDGHAVIETDDGPVEASVSQYDDIPISMIVNIRDASPLVRGRRLGKGRCNSDSDVEALQNAEEAASRHWANRIGARFAVIRSGDVEALAGLLAHE